MGEPVQGLRWGQGLLLERTKRHSPPQAARLRGPYLSGWGHMAEAMDFPAWDRLGGRGRSLGDNQSLTCTKGLSGFTSLFFPH